LRPGGDYRANAFSNHAWLSSISCSSNRLFPAASRQAVREVRSALAGTEHLDVVDADHGLEPAVGQWQVEAALLVPAHLDQRCRRRQGW
jgi:hypothetical protein